MSLALLRFIRVHFTTQCQTEVFEQLQIATIQFLSYILLYFCKTKQALRILRYIFLRLMNSSFYKNVT